MSPCPSHKKSYPSLTLAEDALIDAWIKFQYVPGSGPTTVYKCDDCGEYHFTSKGLMNEKLIDALASGKIKREREGKDWINKLKKNR